jgi:Rrf2 family transcriptional regulator, iron-sulfur cluster assembly transcription factor
MRASGSLLPTLDVATGQEERVLSNTAQYALRAMIYLGQHEGEGPIRVDEIADQLSVPRNYLSKILHALVKARVLRSLRGPHGGFDLARPADSVLLYDVVAQFDDIEARRTCLLGRQECSDIHPCIIHEHWKTTATHVAHFFRETTLAEVVRGAEPPA